MNKFDSINPTLLYRRISNKIRPKLEASRCAPLKLIQNKGTITGLCSKFYQNAWTMSKSACNRYKLKSRSYKLKIYIAKPLIHIYINYSTNYHMLKEQWRQPAVGIIKFFCSLTPSGLTFKVYLRSKGFLSQSAKLSFY